MSQLDTVSFVVPDPKFSYESHLETSDGKPIFTSAYGRQIWIMKALAGFPWDMLTVGEKTLEQSVTENGWSTPEAFKIFASKSYPGTNGSIALMPRYFTPNAYNPPLITLDSTYRLYSNPTTYVEEPLGEYTVSGVKKPCPIMTQLQGPYLIDFGGTLGKQQAIINSFFWGPGFANLERNFYTRIYGWAQWELWATGASAPTQVSAFNMIKPGGCPALDFPGPMPVILP